MPFTSSNATSYACSRSGSLSLRLVLSSSSPRPAYPNRSLAFFLTRVVWQIWNEHAYDVDWIIRLREAMDKDPYAKDVKIVASDQGGWPICADMVKNETLMNAVAIIGSHYPVGGPRAPPTPADCQTLNTKHGKPLWTSEGWNLGQVNDWNGAMNLALTINQNYVQEEQTAMIVWTVIYSWYSIFPFAHPDGVTVGGMGHGLMSATEPWSGHYRIQPTLYTVAHTSQFTRPGACKYLKNSAVGVAPGGWLDAANMSSIVVFVCDEGQHWTAVIETSTAKTLPPTTDFALSNLPSGAPTKLQVCFTSTCSLTSHLLIQVLKVLVRNTGVADV